MRRLLAMVAMALCLGGCYVRERQYGGTGYGDQEYRDQRHREHERREHERREQEYLGSDNRPYRHQRWHGEDVYQREDGRWYAHRDNGWVVRPEIVIR